MTALPADNTGATSDVRPLNVRLHSASEQRLFLAYNTVKYMVGSHGPRFRKGIHLGQRIWSLIADELNALSGVRKTPEMWRKSYTSAKYFVHLKFYRYLKDKKDVPLNWNRFTVKDLLYLQDLRSEGYDNMPEADVLLRACEEKKEYLTDNFQHGNAHLDSQDKLQNINPLSYDHSESSESFEGYNQHASELKNQSMLSSTDYGPDDTFAQIKTEIDVDAGHQEYPPLTHDHNVYRNYGSDMNYPNEGNHMMNANTNTTTDQQSTFTHDYQNMTANSSQQQHNNFKSSFERGNLNRGDFEFEQRILEINGQLLKEKVKQNKILKKRNRILNKQRKEQRKQNDLLNKLLQQLVNRSNSN